MKTRRSGAGGKIVGIVSPHKKHREVWKLIGFSDERKLNAVLTARKYW